MNNPLQAGIVIAAHGQTVSSLLRVFGETRLHVISLIPLIPLVRFRGIRLKTRASTVDLLDPLARLLDSLEFARIQPIWSSRNSGEFRYGGNRQDFWAPQPAEAATPTVAPGPTVS